MIILYNKFLYFEVLETVVRKGRKQRGLKRIN